MVDALGFYKNLENFLISKGSWCLFGSQTDDTSLIHATYLIFLNVLENTKNGVLASSQVNAHLFYHKIP